MTDAGSDNTPTPTDSPVNDAKAKLMAEVINAPSAKTKASSPPSGKDTAKPKKKHKKDRPEPTTLWGKLWYGWIKPIGSVVIVVALLRSTLVDWNDVPSGSMEPNILVGDRIFVNKLAYALQPPLSGPQIGVPFTPLQWNNPLDGLPAWQWGNPVRGDVVTFWNPDSSVRMVKRIVAQPGDTIEMRGGKMFITPAGGERIEATWADGGPDERKNQSNDPKNPNRMTCSYQVETILGQTRRIQHLPERWIDQYTGLVLPDGLHSVNNGNVSFSDGIVPLEQVRQRVPDARMITIQLGTPLVDGEKVSYNAFAYAMLEGIFQNKAITLIGGQELVLTTDGWELDGAAAPIDDVDTALKNYLATNPTGDNASRAAVVKTNLNLLHALMLTSFGPVTLGDDEFYMIGDNRNNSHDSRYFGPIQRSEITGEAVRIAFSFKGRIRDLQPRWSRTLHSMD